MKEIQTLHQSISPRLFGFAPPADQTHRAADRHQAKAGPHDTGDRDMHAGLDGGVVDELLQLFRHRVVFIQLQLDDLAGNTVALQGFDLADEIGAGLQILDLHHTILTGFIGAQILAVFILKPELYACQRIAGTVGFLKLVMVRDIDAQDGLRLLPAVMHLESDILHLRVAFRSSAFADDPFAVIEIAEDDHAVLVADRGFHLFHGGCVVKRELYAVDGLAGGVRLDAHDLLFRVDHSRGRLVRVGVPLVNGDRDHITADKVPIRSGQLADGIFPIIRTDEASHTLHIGNGSHDELAALVIQSKLSALQRGVVLIYLLDQDHGLTVFQRGNRFLGIDERAVNFDGHLREVLQIAGQSFRFLNGVGAILSLLNS